MLRLGFARCSLAVVVVVMVFVWFRGFGFVGWGGCGRCCWLRLRLLRSAGLEGAGRAGGGLGCSAVGFVVEACFLFLVSVLSFGICYFRIVIQ